MEKSVKGKMRQIRKLGRLHFARPHSLRIAEEIAAGDVTPDESRFYSRRTRRRIATYLRKLAKLAVNPQ